MADPRALARAGSLWVLKAEVPVLAVRRRRAGTAQTYLDVLGNHTHMETVYFHDAVEWLRLKRIPVMVIDTSVMTPDGWLPASSWKSPAR